MGLYANIAEWCSRAGHYDGDRELHYELGRQARGHFGARALSLLKISLEVEED